MLLSESSANTLLNGLATLHDSGYIRVFDSTGTELAELTFGATAFAAASGGEIIANAITSESSATAGTADSVTVYASDSTSVLLEGTVGNLDSTADFRFSSLTIGGGDQVRVPSSSYKYSFAIIS